MSKEKEIGKPKEKRKGGRVGTFFLGLFVGLLLTIGLLGGAGCFVFFKVSPAWINRTFGAGLDLPIDENITLYKAVKKVSGLVGNIETYTLNDLKNDFGVDVGNNIYGIDITDLKDVGFGSLSSAINNKFKNISMYELKDVIGTMPESFETILSNENTYHVNNGKLYKEADFSNEVEFEYTIDETNHKLIIKNFEPFSINTDTNEVEVQLRYLPITIALSNITDSISGNITVGELRDTYGITLPSYLDDSVVVSDIENAIKGIQIGRILGFTIDQDGTVKHNGELVEGFMAKIATTNVGDLNQDIIDTFTVKDIFPNEYKQDGDKGVLSLILETTTLKDIPSALKTAISNAELGQLLNVGIISAEYEDILRTKKLKGNDNTLSKMKLTDFLDIILQMETLFENT